MGGGAFIEGHVEAVPRDFDAGWLADITRSAPELLFVARGIGDSMMPTLLDNDTLLVDRGQRQILQQDRIWAITYGELGMIKRVRRRPDGKYLLMSDNPQISEIEALQDELHVVGRVVWIGRKV
jgi:phage repressor protein C with HTH and peptisase S24 domain